MEREMLWYLCVTSKAANKKIVNKAKKYLKNLNNIKKTTKIQIALSKYISYSIYITLNSIIPYNPEYRP